MKIFLLQMQRAGLKPDVVSYALLINAYGKARREEEALAVFEEMLDAGIRCVNSYFHMIRCPKIRDFFQALLCVSAIHFSTALISLDSLPKRGLGEFTFDQQVKCVVDLEPANPTQPIDFFIGVLYPNAAY